MDFSKSHEKELKKILKTHPEIQSLVLCHGMSHYGPLENLSYDQMNEVMQINPASTISLPVSATLRIFSTLSA